MKDENNFPSIQAQMLDSVGEAVMATDLEGKIIYWNRGAERLYQWHADEVMGMDILKVTPSAATLQQAEEIMASLAQGKTWTGDFEVQRKDGSTFLAQVSDTPILNNQGEMTGIIGVSHDVTIQRQTQTSLEQNEKRLRDVLEATNDGIYDWHIPTNQITFNHAYFQMLGYEPDELPHTFETYTNLLHPEDAERSNEKLEQTLSGESEDNRIEMRFKTKSGDWKWLLSRGKVVEADQAGSPIRFVGTNVDIDDRKQLEIALLHERDRAQLYLDLADVIFIALDEAGKITLANRKACQVLGIPEEDLLGQDWFDTCVPERLREDVRTVFNRLMRREIEAVEFYENPVLTSSGDERLIAWHNSILFDQNGVIIGSISSGEDITEKRQVEEALRMSEKRMRGIVNATPFPIALVDDQDDVIDYWSRSAVDLFGHTAPTSDEWYKLAYPDPEYRREVIERWKPYVEKARNSTQAINAGEYRVTRLDGSERICELYAAFLQDRLIVTFNDITERKQAEGELRPQDCRY